MADTIGASMNGMLMDKPNLEGNPIQDTMHRLFWIAGQAGQKAYDVSIGKLAEKLRGTPKSEKTRGTISEELKDLVNIKDAYKGHKTKRIKIKLDPEFESAGSKHLQHDPLDLQTTDPKSGAGIKDPRNTRGQREQVVGQTTSPVMGPQPQGQQGQSETFGGKSPEQQRAEKIEAKTITGGPIGKPVGQIETDQLTQEELDAKPVQPITPEEIAELADEIMGEIPKGEKFDPNRVDPNRVDPDAVRPKTERRFTPEEQAEFNRQQKQREQSEQDKQEKERQQKSLAGAEQPPDPIAAKGVTIESDKPTVEPIDDRLTEEELEAGPDIRQIKEDLPEITPETLEQLEQLGLKPDDNPINPYAQIMGDPVFIKVAVDQFGRELDHTEAGFDKSQIAGFEYRDKQFPDRGKDDAAAGSEEANHWGEIGDLESWFEFEKFNESQQDTGQTEVEPNWNQVRGPDGKIYDKNPNGWKNPNNPSEGLIDRYNPSTWSSTAQWDTSLPDFQRENLPSTHPQHISNQPDHLKPLEGSPGGHGIFAEEPTNAQVESAAIAAGAPQGGINVLFQWTDWEGTPQEGYFNVPISLNGSGRNWSWEYDYRSSGAPSNARPAYGERYGGTFTVEPGP
tara:strand:- start:44 stop:1909 length:1866 start_codon:yes stop_codon:yes gene_type:complete